MLTCNTYATNAPIICNAISEAQSCAKGRGVPCPTITPSNLISELKTASKEGEWCIVDCSTVTTDELREAVAVVWLQGNWDHHPNFRAWFAYEPFLTPLTNQFTLDNATNSNFSLSPTRSSSVADRLRIESANAHLPMSLLAGAVYLKYTSDFETEFNVRSLVNAVGNAQLYYTKEYRRYMTTLQPRHMLGLLRLATREDIFIALVEQGTVNESDRAILIEARGDGGESAIDVALKKEFIEGATLLRDLGCTSEAFDFKDLLKPSFATALRVLLQPDKAFPFDAIATVQHVAREGKSEILKRMFYCRIDVHFEFSDYPLAEACLSESEDTVWVVLDRMGSTGVSPLTEYRWAFYHFIRIVREAAIPGTAKTHTIRRHSTAETFTFNDTSLSLLRRLLRVVEMEGAKMHVPVDVLTKSSAYPDIMQSLMAIIDVDAEPNAPSLLEFFAEFDPKSPFMEGMVRRAYREMPTRMASSHIESEVYYLLWHLLTQGERARPMFFVAVDCCVHYGYLDFTFRGDGGDTLLHKAIECQRFDIEAMQYVFGRLSERDRRNFVNAEDTNGRNAVQRLIDKALNAPAPSEDEKYIANAVRLLFFAGGTLPLEKAKLDFSKCVGAGYPSLTYELMQVSGRTRFNFGEFEKNFALAIADRHRNTPSYAFQKDQRALASNSLTVEEVNAVRTAVGAEQVHQPTYTQRLDDRLWTNTLPFKGPAAQQQKILNLILDFADLPSFNAFHDQCFATYFATMGRTPPPAVPFGKPAPAEEAN